MGRDDTGDLLIKYYKFGEYPNEDFTPDLMDLSAASKNGVVLGDWDTVLQP